MASYITAPGSEPSCCAIMSTPARSAHSVSCSIAAALNVSAAARITFFPCALSPAAILPIEVVLPTPLTPITRSTDLRFSYSYAFSPRFICSLIESIRSCLHSKGSLIFNSLTLAFKSSIIFSVVATPISPIMSISSNSS